MGLQISRDFQSGDFHLQSIVIWCMSVGYIFNFFLKIGIYICKCYIW